MTAVMRKLKMPLPPATSNSSPQMMAPAASTTPSGHAHGFICQAPIANARPSPASASHASPKIAPDRPKMSDPSAKAPKPANSEPTAPIPARIERIVMPVGRSAIVVAAGGDQVVDAGGGADAAPAAGADAGGADTVGGGVGSAGVGSVTRRFPPSRGLGSMFTPPSDYPIRASDSRLTSLHAPVDVP